MISTCSSTGIRSACRSCARPSSSECTRRVPHPLPGGQRRAGPARPAERGEPAPPQPQLRHGRVPAAGVQPQVQPQPHGTGPGTAAARRAAGSARLQATRPAAPGRPRDQDAGFMTRSRSAGTGRDGAARSAPRQDGGRPRALARCRPATRWPAGSRRAARAARRPAPGTPLSWCRRAFPGCAHGPPAALSPLARPEPGLAPGGRDWQRLTVRRQPGDPAARRDRALVQNPAPETGQRGGRR